MKRITGSEGIAGSAGMGAAAGAGACGGDAGSAGAAAAAGEAGAAAGAAGFGVAFWAALARFGFDDGGGSRISRLLGAVVFLPPEARSLGTMSSGTLEEADRPVTPISSRVVSSSLLLTPSSLASS
jgi:hypothetical protein